MAEHEDKVLARLRTECDMCGAVRTSLTYGPDDHEGCQEMHLAALVSDGWRIYVSRTRRVYCPDCGPRPGHNMRLVMGGDHHG